MVTLPPLDLLAKSLREHPNVAEKLSILNAYSPALGVSSFVDVGDDTAAIQDGDGYLLFAAEGMIEGFIERDPWFAGYCAVMVNLSDIAAMGGRPTAIVDVLWTNPDSPIAKELWEGMRAASTAYGVPIVGGHTTRFPAERTPLLATAVLGKAKSLISSFTARPGDVLLMAVDMRAAFRGEGTLFWNASVGSPPERLQGDLELLPLLAEAGLVTGGKDISNGGVPGTLSMFCATSRYGASVDLDAVPKPPDVEWLRWLLSFPSYGYLLTARPEHAQKVIECFSERELTCAVIGAIEEELSITLHSQGEAVLFCEVVPPPAAAP